MTAAPNSRSKRWRNWITARLVTLSRVYFTLLFVWAAWRLFMADRWWWLFLLNSFGVYFFFPLPVILLIALLARRRETWLGWGVSLALGLHLFGGLFVPKLPSSTAGSPALTVMTYNLLGFNQNQAGIVAALRASRADVIALQELNPELARAIERDLPEYPHRALDPQPGVTGMGVISRYPVLASVQMLPGEMWVGQPQVLEMNWNGRTVTVLHFHPVPTNLMNPAIMQWSVSMREQQARAVAAFAAAQPAPLIAPVDFNANDQSAAYGSVTRVLQDAWREAGWGLGHTFPGAASFGSSRPSLRGMPVPMWLTRIDHIFYSRHWRAEAAWLAPWDGQSDHRPVAARLILRP